MKRILYIEDELGLLEMVKERLLSRGYEVSVADGADLGLKRAFAEKPDLILLDIFMPDMDGFAVCRKLKEDPRTKDIPILFITASGVEYVAEQAKHVGADDLIMKPYEPEELIARIKKLLKEL